MKSQINKSVQTLSQISKTRRKILPPQIKWTPYFSIPQEKTSVLDDILKERESIKNQGLRQDLSLKKITLVLLFALLILETIATFALSVFQATHAFNFKLEEWSFKLIITATILQISYLVRVAVKHLFPEKK